MSVMNSSRIAVGRRIFFSAATSLRDTLLPMSAPDRICTTVLSSEGNLPQPVKI